MKRELIIALGGVLAFSAPGLAQTQMFQVNSSSPGQVSFSGSGTATYNNSVGTNNSINLGSASALSLSGSVAGTPDYQASSSSLLNLDSSTTFTQSVGTASDAANTKSTVDAVSKSAHEVAYSAASKAEANWSSGYLGYNSAQAAYEGEYNRAYENAFTRSYSRAVAQDSSTESTGTVSGEFTTANKGRAVGAAASVDYDASASANAKYGYKYQNSSASHGNSGTTFASSGDWKAAWDAEYAAAYSAANGDSSSTSTSSVNVEGIGNVASVTVGDGTSMDVDMGLRASPTATGQNGSANGSANLTLNTASTAAVSNSQFASGFIQAFEAN